FEWFADESDDSPDYISAIKVDNFPVSPNDEIFACACYIEQNTRGRFFMTNVVTGNYFTIDLDPPPNAVFNGSFVEWIVEALNSGEPKTSIPQFNFLEFKNASGVNDAVQVANPLNGGKRTLQRLNTNLVSVTLGNFDVAIKCLPWYDTDVTSASGTPTR